jgi:hypothetical protein
MHQLIGRCVFWASIHALILFLPRTKLSKALPTQVSKVELRPIAELRDKYGVNLRTGVVSSLHPESNYHLLGPSYPRP